MSKDQAIGILLLTAGVLGIIIYGWLVFFSKWSLFVLQLTGFIAVALILAIVSWIGYTMATTPPPEPAGDITSGLGSDKEKKEESTTKQEEKA